MHCHAVQPSGAVLQPLLAQLQPQSAPKLRHLVIVSGDLRGHCLGLAGLTQGRVLCFDFCYVTGADLIKLSGLTKLRCLRLKIPPNQVWYGQESMDSLAKGLSQLTLLKFEDWGSGQLPVAVEAFKQRLVRLKGCFLTLRPIYA